MDKMFLELIDPKTLPTVSINARNDYWGSESLYAGYIMGEINLGKRLLIIPGVRYERGRTRYDGRYFQLGLRLTK